MEEPGPVAEHNRPSGQKGLPPSRLSPGDRHHHEDEATIADQETPHKEDDDGDEIKTEGMDQDGDTDAEGVDRMLKPRLPRRPPSVRPEVPPRYIDDVVAVEDGNNAAVSKGQDGISESESLLQQLSDRPLISRLRNDTVENKHGGEGEVSEPIPSRRLPVALPISQQFHQSHLPSRNTVRPSHVVQHTLFTGSASWSRERGRKPPSGPTRTVKDVRLDLRERLKGYASSSGTIMVDELDSEKEERTLQGQESHEEDNGKEQDESDLENASSGSEGGDEHHGLQEGGRGEAMDAIDPATRQPTAQPVGRDIDGPIFEDEGESVDEDAVVGSTVSNDELALASRSSRSPSAFRAQINSLTAQGELSLRFDLPRLRERYASKARRKVSAPRGAYDTLQSGAIASDAGIDNRDSSLAEAALSRVISKSDFVEMKVLGQFNKGFIIARLQSKASDDLFIVDQHACDEKFNFETLQRTTIIKAQSLIR